MTKKNKLWILVGICFVAFSIFSSCFKEEKHQSPEHIDFTELPYEKISDYGFFIGDLNKLVPCEDILIYEPISPLFTDYASKSRYVWMADGGSASILDDLDGSIEFPNKTILIKNFYYENDESQSNVETRLLVKNNDVWQAYPYLWNDEQSDAVYNITGSNIAMNVMDYDGNKHDMTYIQPNKNQCKSCHNSDQKLMPIGPKAINLNFEIEYKEGERMNQLDKWKSFGYLSNYTSSENYNAMVSYNDVHADLDLRAKAYLTSNCGHCHNASGPASTSGLFMTYQQEDLKKLGLYKTPVAAGKGAGSFEYDIYPGHADSSILIYRLNSVEPGIMMAELGRSLVHKEGVELISEWINQLENPE